MIRRWETRLKDSAHLFRGLARNSAIRNALIAFLLFTAVEYGTWVAFLLYAYEATGPTSVGVVALVLLIPATVFAPIAASLGDRIRRDRFLVIGYACQLIALGLVAVAMASDLDPLLVYALACLSSSAMTMTRPAQGALLPSLAETPEELTAANGLTAVFEGAGVLVGPLAAAVILMVTRPTAVVVAGTVALGLATILATRVHLSSADVPASSEADREATTTDIEAQPEVVDDVDPTRSLLAGFRLTVQHRDLRLLIGLLCGRMLLIGAFDVLFVLMALELFHTGEAGAGVLSAAIGAGGMIGGAATLGVAGRRRLGPALVLGAIVAGVSVIAIGMAPSTVSAPLLIATSAVGLAVLDATGRTMLQRSISDDTLARAFGVLEGLTMAALGLGSILVPILVAAFGLQGAILFVGAILPTLAFLGAPGLRRVDASIVVPERELALLTTVPMFAPLRPEVLEALARRASWALLPAGATLIAEGDPGDRYYVLSSGVLDVSHGGSSLATLSEPGLGVGEIALLFDIPRTATVTIVDDAELLVVERPDFLTAVTGHPEVHRAVRRVADDRLA